MLYSLIHFCTWQPIDEEAHLTSPMTAPAGMSEPFRWLRSFSRESGGSDSDRVVRKPIVRHMSEVCPPQQRSFLRKYTYAGSTSSSRFERQVRIGSQRIQEGFSFCLGTVVGTIWHLIQLFFVINPCTTRFHYKTL